MSKLDLKLENFLTEKETQEYFGLKREQIGNLRRNEGLPYIRISRTQRLYFEKDVIEWLLSRRYKGGSEISSSSISN
jgi:hypothetical protein